MTMPVRSRKFLGLTLFGAMSMLSFGLGASVDADHRDKSLNRLLRGSYFFTQMNSCVTTRQPESPPTFDPDTLDLVGPAESIIFQSEGVTRFDGRGGVSNRGTAMAIFLDRDDAGESPIGPPLPFTCKGKYSVTTNREFEAEFACTGPLFDVAPIRLTGAISTDRKTLIFADAEPTIEKLIVDGNVVGERICIAMATDIRKAN